MADDIISTLETLNIRTRERRIVHTARAHFEAPNWSPNNDYFIVNSGGRLYRVPSTGGTMREIDTGFAARCNNDHGISSDGRWLAISHHIGQNRSSHIFVLPVDGGEPRQVTQHAPSYWHGWSPDGRSLVYCAERNGDWDVYRIGVDGGKETRLTHTRELDDGPEFSPDGQHIFFNAFRDGKMQLWQMRADGSQQRQLTFDSHSNWFPHPSPDGRWLTFVSYIEDQRDRHPPMKDVTLRLMSLDDGTVQTLARFVGGQGSINVPSWSPDGERVAFVTYEEAP